MIDARQALRLVFAVAVVSTLAGGDGRPDAAPSSADQTWRAGVSSHATASACKKRRRRRRTTKVTKPARKPDPKPEAPASDLVPSTSFRGPTRIDFDDRLIQGQTNKSGAVYLFDRKETGISSMVKRRKSFRRLTIQTIYDR